MAWKLRAAHVEEAAQLAKFAAATFTEAFGADNDPEDLAQHLERSFGEEQQTAQLEDPSYRTLVATREGDGEFSAYAQVRLGDSPDCVTASQPVELLRFYVAGKAHGQGLAQELMAAALQSAADLGGRQVWLSVWEKNPRALAFYAKEGFEDVGSADFWVGSDRQTDRILLRELDGE